MASTSAANLIDEIVDKIRTKILRGELRPGDRLKQESLADEFAVSRTPIREALTRLEASGVISQEQRRSAIVNKPSSRDIAEMYQIRAELEGLAAQLAGRWMTDQRLIELRTIHRRFVDAVHALQGQRTLTGKGRPASPARRQKLLSAAWIESNAQFHRTICKASRNRNLERYIEDLNYGYARSVMLSSSAGMDRHRMVANVSHHEAILAALEKRDPAAARQAMEAHVHESGAFVMAWFESADE